MATRKRKPVPAPVRGGSESSQEAVLAPLPLDLKLLLIHFEKCQLHQALKSSLSIMPSKVQCLLTGRCSLLASTLSRSCQARRGHSTCVQALPWDYTPLSPTVDPQLIACETYHHPDNQWDRQWPAWRKHKVHDSPKSIYDTDDPGGWQPKQPWPHWKPAGPVVRSLEAACRLGSEVTEDVRSSTEQTNTSSWQLKIV